MDTQREFTIYTAPHRTTKTWTPTTYTWDRLAQKLTTHITHPTTSATYHTLTKEQQGRIKDQAGGYVGGTLKDGHRRKNSITQRCLITLDLDTMTQTKLDEIQLGMAPNGLDHVNYATYTTHSATVDNPKARIVYPLAVDVEAAHYEPIARAIAHSLGDETMDPTTFQPERFMYWPTCPTDGFHRASKETQLGFLHPYQWMENHYPQVRLDDPTTWPGPHKGGQQTLPTPAPTTAARKPSPIVEAFNTAYPIRDAITTFLADVYAPTGDKNRFTKIGASTSGGLVIHDDGKATSFHSTDPVGESVSAFDLVRIHRFGGAALTAGWDESCQQMATQLVLPDPHCRALIPQDIIDNYEANSRRSAPLEQWILDELAKNEEDTVDDRAAGGADTDPKTKTSVATLTTQTLDLTDTGQPRKTIRNFQVAISQAGITIGKNLLANKVEIQAPWAPTGKPLTDEDEARIMQLLEQNHKGLYQAQKCRQAIDITAGDNEYHPMRDYLRALPDWDGVERLDTLLIDYLGAEDTSYTRDVTRKTLLAAITRTFRPGAKFDTMLVLSGPQGCGKSTLVAKLGGQFYSDALTMHDMADDKAGIEKLQGYTLLEIGELAGIRKADVETLKAFISRQIDRYRPAYARRVEECPRQCVFIGTTNQQGFLHDTTGNRRFWPVAVTGQCPKHPWELDQETVDQVWAEAMKIFKQEDEVLYLVGESAVAARVAQDEAIEADDRLGLVQQYLELGVPADWESRGIDSRVAWVQAGLRGFHGGENTDPFGDGFGVVASAVRGRDRVSVVEVWVECFGKPQGEIRRQQSLEIAQLLRKLGWEPGGLGRCVPYGVQRVFTPTPK